MTLQLYCLIDLQRAPSICRQLQSIRKGGRVHRLKSCIGRTSGPVPNHRYISGDYTFSCEVCNPFKSYQIKLRRSGSSCFLINEPGQHFIFFFLYTSFHTTGIMGRGIFKTAACRGSAVQIFLGSPKEGQESGFKCKQHHNFLIVPSPYLNKINLSSGSGSEFLLLHVTFYQQYIARNKL